MKKLIIVISIISVFALSGCTKTQSTQTKNTKGTNTTAEKNSSTNAVDKNVDKALQVISSKVKMPNSNYHLEFDHKDKVNGTDYYVFHAFEVVKDDAKSSHTVTFAWYYVEVSDYTKFYTFSENLPS